MVVPLLLRYGEVEWQMNDDILEGYGLLLEEVDEWFRTCHATQPAAIACGSGCSACCRGLFDITLLDAWYLKKGFDQLPPAIRESVLTEAWKQLERLQTIWPDLNVPYILNYRPEEEWEDLMPNDDETPCLLLDEEGRCLVYDHRPMTCRLHGIPLVDRSGEIMHDEWCTLNFVDLDPLAMPELRGEFNRIFEKEVALFRTFTDRLLGERISELDSFIPLALLQDFRGFDWRGWWERGKN